MKTQETTPGKTYSVHTSSGCTVSDKNGWSKTIDAPEGYFTAHAKEVTIDGDDAASVKELFKLAPAALVSGGGAASGGPEGDYVTLDAKGAITGGRLDTLEDGYYLQYGKSTLTSWDIPLPSLTNGYYMFNNCESLASFKGDLSSLTSGNYMFYNTSLKSFESDLPALTTGAGMFGWCQLNKESALRVLNSIPEYTSGTHKLTIGIHVDHQTDEEVIAAITAAEAKKWTITAQWNGTATEAASVSTYGLRRGGDPIYAKIGEPEEDGTQRLDWGHYVTNWEENGYQEFASVEEAEEYFNINQTEEE